MPQNSSNYFKDSKQLSVLKYLRTTS